jgi:alkylation response protein AidB-like acyl-CoA dehydrogenase
MRLDLTADQRLLQSATAGFLASTSPVAVTRALHAEGRSFDSGTWRRGAELGWTSLLVPEDLGGGSVSGAGLIDATIIAEQFGAIAAPGPFLPVNVVAFALAEAASAVPASAVPASAVPAKTREPTAARAGLLKRLLAGEAIASWACCPPGGGWNPEAGAITAVPEGEGYRLTGVHEGVEAAADADAFLVLARVSESTAPEGTAPESTAPGGLTQLIVPATADGLTVTPMGSLDLTRGFGRVSYDGVVAGPEAVLGSPGEAAGAVERQFQVAVVLQCAELAGVAGTVLEFTRQWMADRFTFGRPLESYQALKHRFADLTTWSHALQAATAAAAAAVHEQRDDAAEVVSIAKAYAGQRATDIVQDCVQLHGGLGVTWEHDIHVYLRRATAGRVTWGTPSQHRRRIAGLLGV